MFDFVQLHGFEVTSKPLPMSKLQVLTVGHSYRNSLGPGRILEFLCALFFLGVFFGFPAGFPTPLGLF